MFDAASVAAVDAAVAAAAAGSPPGYFLQQYQALHLYMLGKVWQTPGAKVVCLNDDIDDVYGLVRALINPVVTAFLASRYSTPSKYELLPPGRVNGCRR